MIITVTLSPALDRTLTIENFTAGKVNRVLSSRTDPGGKGINVSKVLKELGAKTLAMGILGGQTGKEIETRLHEMDIDTDFIYSVTPTRTNIKISDPATGLTTDINSPASLTKEEADRVLNNLLTRVNSGDCVVLAGKMDERAADAEKWVTALKQAGAFVFLDTERGALKSGVQAGPYLIKPNEAELMMLCGKEFQSDGELIASARRLTDSCETVAVSMGEKGAYFFTKDEGLFVAAPSVPCVCTVGAGDTMTACLAYGKAAGMDFTSACVLSVAASAAAVSCPGTSVPSKALIDSLIPTIRPGRIY